MEMGNKIVIFALFLNLFSAFQLLSYTKFKFIERTAKGDLNAMRLKPPFSLEKADYYFSDQNGLITNYVFLSTPDRKQLQKTLANFDKKETISLDMIKRFKSSGRFNDNFVGLILQDFKTTNQEVTVGNILDAIKIKNPQKQSLNAKIKM